MPNDRDKKKRWRPWQFSRRALLTLMLAVACFLGGWMANDWYRDVPPDFDGLSKAHSEVSSEIVRVKAELASGKLDGIKREAKENELARKVDLQEAISARIAERNTKTWSVLAALSLAILMMIFIGIAKRVDRVPTAPHC